LEVFVRLPSTISHVVSIAALALAFTACSAIESVGRVEKSTAEVGEKMDKTNDGIDRTNKKMDETNGSIDETNQKMDEVRRQMDEMNNKLVETNKRMEIMNSELDRMYQDLRQGDSLNARLQTLDKLTTTPRLKSKLVFAAQYFMSYEFQLWKGQGSDGEEVRQMLRHAAADEFVQVVRRLSQTSFPINILDESNEISSLKALAIALHTVNPNTKINSQTNKFAPESMHLLLTQALGYGHKLSQSKVSAEKIPDFAKVVLKEPELVKYLFELRVNMLPAMVVSAMSQTASDEFVTRWMARAGVVLKPWTAQTRSLNELQLREYADWISWANADVAQMKAFGLQPRFDATLLRTLKNMRLAEDSEQGNESMAAIARLRAFKNLRDELGKFISQTE
jgi:myosin heavy subunit